MNIQQIQPPDCLREYVRYFWTLEYNNIGGETRSFRTIPDGCPGLIFEHSDKGTLFRQEKELPPIFLYGQSTGFSELHLNGAFSTIGIFFYPHALKGVFGLDAGELTDSCLDLNDLALQRGFPLTEQLLNAISIQEQIGILSAFLSIQIRRNTGQIEGTIQYVLSQLSQSKGSASLKDLLITLQLSERSLERKFQHQVGISPKLFSRICRFQESLIQLKKNNYSKLSDIAYENGYADQSHFIRAFKEFAGSSPFQYQKNSLEVVDNLAELRK